MFNNDGTSVEKSVLVKVAKRNQKGVTLSIRANGRLINSHSTSSWKELCKALFDVVNDGFEECANDNTIIILYFTYQCKELNFYGASQSLSTIERTC